MKRNQIKTLLAFCLLLFVSVEAQSTEFRVIGPTGESINITAPMFLFNHDMTVEPSTVGESLADYTFSFTIS